MKQERAAHTRQSLIRSAAEAFEQHGYVRASLAQISSSAGVSTGALHFHFANKAALASTVEASAAVVLRRSAQAAQRPDLNALQQLISTSHALADQLCHDAVARAGYRLNCETPHRTGLELRGEWQECVRHLLARAAEDHLLADGIACEDLTTSVTAATIGFEVLGRRDFGWLSPASLTRFWRLVLPRWATAPTLAGLDPEQRPATT
ncbi:ScbR family autoregulator-binding transcription factor [Streptomyces resistomycificus]|uniref:TetR family transcriptional regulator n=1 Tax=Streptomyces resistomycificus TaxID=67356 RepID=A0A0L8LS88_9ACTN|nr:ScbR family autoregulator-binding transcription factor [Streptomyces resistomycificus]KOG40964.1 TetR family transcriptional regulator [Streptomyces resistomycificus]KUN90610.1 TetR family transcriptional regulator [Streptomyces resistomycificus]